ncbi:MAG TPA: hypothetical protein PKZ27_02850 [Rhodocyclaceae bacterium]|nr:hypothetical protein [Burkholderiaceae bacterium]HRP74504.1 hypothetical protein [Rhodocyclaceae bacterium]
MSAEDLDTARERYTGTQKQWDVMQSMPDDLWVHFFAVSKTVQLDGYFNAAQLREIADALENP